MFTVTSQRRPDGTLIVEVSRGGIDYTNPDALVAKYDGEFEEFSNPVTAVEAAITICRAWRKDSRKRITVGVGATLGMTMPFDSGTFADARKWAEEVYATLPKCAGCNEPMESQTWHANDWDGLDYCSEHCATRAAEFEGEQDAEFRAEESRERD